ncbi:hypothetical protein SO694_0000186 [Aureococcus anophagefferens]|uniref:Uncharacterized protein n=1 Tax=Aureococcus anophagefferens TaxID=44056 RepID=A0ABR1GCB0_AURAN
MCLCCLGWGLFLYNYANGRAREPRLEDVTPNAQILAGQAGVSVLDYFFWTLFASFIYYIMTNAKLEPATRSCCGDDAAEKETMLAATPRRAARRSSSPPCCKATELV